MGDWMTVMIDGECPAAEVTALKAAILPGENYENWGALSNSGPSLCGLGDWPSTQMNVVGNCAERGFTPEGVAGHLRDLVKAAPGLRVKVHCGGPYEDKTCVATVICDADGVRVGPPERSALPELSEDAMTGRLFTMMTRPPERT